MSRKKGDVVSILAMAEDAFEEEELAEQDPPTSTVTKAPPGKKTATRRSTTSDNLFGLEPRERKAARPVHRLSVDVDAEIYDGFLALCTALGRSQRSVVMEMLSKAGGTTEVFEKHYPNHD